MELVVNDRFRRPDGVHEGLDVVAPVHLKELGWRALRCKVLVAAGKHARVVNERRGVDQWFEICNLRVEHSP